MDTATEHSFAYIESDIPPSMTIAGYRRRRAARRRRRWFGLGR